MLGLTDYNWINTNVAGLTLWDKAKLPNLLWCMFFSTNTKISIERSLDCIQMEYSTGLHGLEQ